MGTLVYGKTRHEAAAMGTCSPAANYIQVCIKIIVLSRWKVVILTHYLAFTRPQPEHYIQRRNAQYKDTDLGAVWWRLQS